MIRIYSGVTWTSRAILNSNALRQSRLTSFRDYQSPRRLLSFKSTCPSSRASIHHSSVVRKDEANSRLENSSLFPQSAAPKQSYVKMSSAIILCLAGSIAGFLVATNYDTLKSTFFSTDSDSDEYFTNPKFGSPEDFKRAIAELRAAFSDEDDAVTTDPHDLHDHGFSVNDYLPGEQIIRPQSSRQRCHVTCYILAGSLHSVIVHPQTTEDVVKIMGIATKYRMPVVPYSGGTSLEGHTRGVSLNLNNPVSTLWRHIIILEALQRRNMRRHVKNGQNITDQRLA